MSVHLDALADEVFDAAAAQGRGDGDIRRLPFGEVRRNPEYPDLFFLNGLADLIAPDWTVADLERCIAAYLPGIVNARVSSRDPATIASLGPRLLQAGYQADCRVAMLQVAPVTAHPTDDLRVVQVDTPEQWRAFEELIGQDTAEHGWTGAMTAQLIRLYRWQASNQPEWWLLAHAGREAVGYVGLYQHGAIAYLHALYTRASARRRGTGSALIDEVRRRADALGCGRVTLQCTRDSPLPPYYEARGFRTVGEMSIWMKSNAW